MNTDMAPYDALAVRAITQKCAYNLAHIITVFWMKETTRVISTISGHGNRNRRT